MDARSPEDCKAGDFVKGVASGNTYLVMGKGKFPNSLSCLLVETDKPEVYELLTVSQEPTHLLIVLDKDEAV